MFAGKEVKRESVVSTILGTKPGSTVLKGGFAVEISLMATAAAKTNSGIVYSFNNFRRT